MLPPKPLPAQKGGGLRQRALMNGRQAGKTKEQREIIFVWKNRMITDEEMRAVKKGNARIDYEHGYYLLPLNMNGYTNGQHIKLYTDRREQVLMDQLLGLPMKHT